MSHPKPDWQAGDLRLTAPETYVLLHGDTSIEPVVALALQELLLCKVLTHSRVRWGLRSFQPSRLEVTTGALVLFSLLLALFNLAFVLLAFVLSIVLVFFLLLELGSCLSKADILQKGPNFEMPLSSQSLSVVRDRFRLEQPHTFAGGIDGVFLYFARSARYGYSIDRDVLPVLVERGFYRAERAESSWTGSESPYARTLSGEQARDAVLRSLAAADEHFRDWAEHDPARAVRFVARAGPAMLLASPSVREGIQRLDRLPELAELGRSGSGTGNVTGNAELALEFVSVSSEWVSMAAGGSEKAVQTSEFIGAFNSLVDVYRAIDSQPGTSGDVGGDGGEGGGGGDGGGGGGSG